MAGCLTYRRTHRSVWLCGLLFWAVTLALIGIAWSAGSKQFSDFPAIDTFSGVAARPDEKTAPENWSAVDPVEKEIILEQMAKGPNFAGAYYLATVGCGTGCEAIFVIDMRDGRIYRWPEAASNGVVFQKDSRLIIIRENKDYDLPRVYLVFDRGDFKKID